MKSDVIRELYKRFGITAASNFMFRALYFGCYDTGKELLLTKEYRDNFLAKFFLAQFAVILATTGAYPIDTVRKRISLQSNGDIKEYANAFDCAWKVWKKEGLKPFFAGNCASIMSIRTIFMSLALVLYDELKKLVSPKL